MQYQREQNRDEKKYEDIAKRARELREQKEEIENETNTEEEDTEEFVPARTFNSGLIKGEVIDFEYKETYHSGGKLKLDVRTSTDETVRVKVNDTGDYDDDNELASLLEWKGITDGRIGELIGEKITLASSNYIDRQTEAKDIEWNVYLPSKQDTVGKTVFRFDSILRRIGVQGLDKVLHQDGVADLLLVSMLFGCFWAIFTIASLVILAPLALLSANLFYLTLFVVNLYWVTVLRYLHAGWLRYKQKREQNSLA